MERATPLTAASKMSGLTAWAALVASGAALALLLAGCGGRQKQASGTPSGPKPNAAGAKVFTSAGCGNCHTLKAAGSKGTVGPNLDDLKPAADRVARQVRNGGVGMRGGRRAVLRTRNRRHSCRS